MRQIIQSIIVLLIGTANWLGIINDDKNLEYTAKPIVLIVISLFYAINTKLQKKGDLIVLLGFLFSLSGDIFLMYDGYFIQGLLSFAVAHLFFIIAFTMYKTTNQKHSEGLKSSKVTIIITVIFVYCVFIFSYLLPFIPDDLKVAVIFYGLLLGAMGIFALLRNTYTNNYSFKFGFIGGLFFISSDSILALNLFAGYKSIFIRFMVMFTYYIAQICIWQSMEEHSVSIQRRKKSSKQQFKTK
ncbi:hypothetical protein PPERSA_01557 [Pseudocohnilembus persalinus]|uniref:YhhN-like protein n=1 Tax=Pseudocohnilembus persalinus TaxID=266149 RepID=A0A0V0QHI6_PSEPJ|nr:hypothetical protein PPERSA_01557 [Pseudocohnilembus persalinus]|eukprot:KRX01687.1 hypothetical protein PPERSA_01557 [Pseudocohnilembus persalinus]